MPAVCGERGLLCVDLLCNRIGASPAGLVCSPFPQPQAALHCVFGGRNEPPSPPPHKAAAPISSGLVGWDAQETTGGSWWGGLRRVCLFT